MQRSNPRLYIPSDDERSILAFSNRPGYVGDLVLRPLIAQPDLAGNLLGVFLVLARPRVSTRFFVGGAREEAGFERGEGVWGYGCWDDGVPDDGFGDGGEVLRGRRGGRGGRGAGAGWIGNEDVDEELFCVPIEEGG